MRGNLNEGETASARRGDVEIWLGRPDAASYFDVATLSPTDRERFATIRNPRRLQEFKVSRALRAYARASGSAVESLSHSGGHAAFAMGPAGTSVGIDLEVYRPRNVLRLARNVFSAAEIEALQSAQGAQRDRLFYALWTLKEALAKALRLNLMDALRQCTFAVNDGVWQGDAPTQSRWSASVFAPAQNVCLAVACIGDCDLTALRMWEWPPGEPARWPISARAASPLHASSPADAAAPQATTP